MNEPPSNLPDFIYTAPREPVSEDEIATRRYDFAPPEPPPKRRQVAPVIGVITLMVALVGATIITSHPGSAVAGAETWLPGEGYRIQYETPGNSDLKFSEWSRPHISSLGQSNMLGFPIWVRLTDQDIIETPYLRMRTVDADTNGESTALFDNLWTLSTDGARAAVEVSIRVDGETPELDIAVMIPGRLDLPSDLAAGNTWASQGVIITWDNTAEEYVDSHYQAVFQAVQSSDADYKTRGCLDVTMEQTIGDKSSTTVRTWCPSDGIASFSDGKNTWTTSSKGLPVNINAEEPFDWGKADTLSFSPLTIEPPDLLGLFVMSPIESPGILAGAATFTSEFPPDVYAISLDDQPHVQWGIRPGGTPTASATLGGMTLVATTNRQVIAYNDDGRWLWEATLTDISVVPPIRLGDQAIVVGLDGSVTALDLRFGTTTWQTSIGGEIRSLPLFAQNRLLVANQMGALACIDPEGNTEWVVDAGVPRSMAVSPGPDPVVIYGNNKSVVLRAYSLADGHQVWRNRVYQDALDLVALDEVVVLRDNDMVLGIDWFSGEIVWRWSGQRTVAGLGGGQRVLIFGDSDLILLNAAGTEVRTWPHSIPSPSEYSSYLMAMNKTVLAYTGSKMEIGVLP